MTWLVFLKAHSMVCGSDCRRERVVAGRPIRRHNNPPKADGVQDQRMRMSSSLHVFQRKSQKR